MLELQLCDNNTSLVHEDARDGTDENVVDRDADDGIEKADPSTELSSWSDLPVSNSRDGGEAKEKGVVIAPPLTVLFLEFMGTI